MLSPHRTVDLAELSTGKSEAATHARLLIAAAHLSTGKPIEALTHLPATRTPKEAELRGCALAQLNDFQHSAESYPSASAPVIELHSTP